MRKLLLIIVTTLLAAACSSGSAPKSGGTPAVHWTGSSGADHGPAGPIDVATVCGSSTETYLLELRHHPPTSLKVTQEWGDVTPGGRQVLVSGTVASANLGPGDLPIDHPLGDDLSMDIKLDTPFTAYSQKLGSAPTDVVPGDMHVEISSGFIPHVRRPPSATAGQLWPDLSVHNMTGFQPGFAHPEIGDPVLVAGRYIVDCGHPDYHTELHPISFLAWAHRTGSTTLIHFYANGYRDTEYYNPDPALVGKLADSARMSDPHTTRFPAYLISQVFRLLSGAIPQLQAFEMVGNAAPPSSTWQVCAAGSGGRVRLAYDIRERPGVAVGVTPQPGGCAGVSIAVPSGYSSPDIDTHTCVATWSYISKVAGQALAGQFDARSLIQGFLPAKDAALVDRDPVVGCADGLSGPEVAAQPSSTRIETDAGQPFPLYGTLTLTRS